MIIDQDCVTLTIPGPPTPQKQRGYLVSHKKFFNPNKNEQRKLKKELMKEVAMKDLYAMLPWPKNTAVDISAVFYFSLTDKDRAGGRKVDGRCLKHVAPRTPEIKNRTRRFYQTDKSAAVTIQYIILGLFWTCVNLGK